MKLIQSNHFMWNPSCLSFEGMIEYFLKLNLSGWSDELEIAIQHDSPTIQRKVKYMTVHGKRPGKFNEHGIINHYVVVQEGVTTIRTDRYWIETQQNKKIMRQLEPCYRMIHWTRIGCAYNHVARVLENHGAKYLKHLKRAIMNKIRLAGQGKLSDDVLQSIYEFLCNNRFIF